MELDTEQLRAGANHCQDAAGMATSAAGKLADKTPAEGIFGDFAEARAFHGALSAVHQDHVERMRGHDRALTEISDKSRSAAVQFTAGDVSSADALRAAGAGVGSV
jgi:hypothetical protein